MCQIVGKQASFRVDDDVRDLKNKSMISMQRNENIEFTNVCDFIVFMISKQNHVDVQKADCEKQVVAAEIFKAFCFLLLTPRWSVSLTKFI